MNEDPTFKEILLTFSRKYQGDFIKEFEAILNREQVSREEADSYLKNVNHETITIVDEDYPENFKTLTNPPIVLYYQGNRALFDEENNNMDIKVFKEDKTRVYTAIKPLVADGELKFDYIIATEKQENLGEVLDIVNTNDIPLIDYSKANTNEMDLTGPKEIDVLVIEPDKHPYQARIPNTLSALQAIVDGNIEEVYLDDDTAIICNEEGKLNNLKANRSLGNDVIAGTFIVVGANSRNEFYTSLSDKRVAKFSEKFFKTEDHDQSELLDKTFAKFVSR